jgi:hypothetical protein
LTKMDTSAIEKSNPGGRKAVVREAILDTLTAHNGRIKADELQKIVLQEHSDRGWRSAFARLKEDAVIEVVDGFCVFVTKKDDDLQVF